MSHREERVGRRGYLGGGGREEEGEEGGVRKEKGENLNLSATFLSTRTDNHTGPREQGSGGMAPLRPCPQRVESHREAMSILQGECWGLFCGQQGFIK